MGLIQNQTISLVTYNIHKGFGVGKLRFLLPQMRIALSGLNPDFVYLQEVQGQHKKKEKRISAWPDLSQFEYIAKRDWQHYLYAKNAIYRSGHHGNAILSKFAFEQFNNINLSAHNRASRSILHGQIKLGHAQPTRLHLLCVHLGLFKKERSLQCQTLMQLISNTVPENEPLLMAGDFNDWRNQLSEPLAKIGINEAFFCHRGHYARSFPAIKPTLCVDRIYFRGLIVQEVHCLQGKPWRMLSDHLPLYAKFQLPEY